MDEDLITIEDIEEARNRPALTSPYESFMQKYIYLIDRARELRKTQQYLFKFRIKRTDA